MIKAPYNFVPLSEKVVFPEWASQISHDIPFSDGISGTISVTLTAKSPIFVSNGNASRDGDNKSNETESFCRLDSKSGKYFIPGTSVKGAIRNVLEIMSFSKMRLDPNAKFAEREWNNPSLYTLKGEQGSMRCGWLRPDGDHYVIVDCGKPYRIAQTRIDDYLGTHVFKNNFSKACGLNLNEKRLLDNEALDPKTAKFKYRLIEQIASLGKLRDLRFAIDEEYATESNNSRLEVSSQGDTIGTIVLTGQPDLWAYPRPKRLTRGAGKFYEFVFKKPNPNRQTKYILTEEEFNHYKFIYADSDDWKYAEDKFLSTSGIPVFFRIDKKTDKIKDWGLAFLYKLPYDHTPHELLPGVHRSDMPDMAECIFGYVHDKSALKGRVQFTPFWSHNARQENRMALALCSPKASYYPIYISQEEQGNNGIMTAPYKTYNDGGLKGWKRYVVRQNTWCDRTNSDTIDTIIAPLSEGTSFIGKIIFHNLKPEELGALLSAITFHGNENNSFHQIGMAKPYGYGKVKAFLSDISLKPVGETNFILPADYRSFMAVFERYMTQNIQEYWPGYAAVKELLTLVRNEIHDNSSFNYMKLDMNGTNEFKDAKGGDDGTGTRYALRYFSDIIGRKEPVNSLIENCKNDVESIDLQRLKHAERIKKVREAAAIREAECKAEKERLEMERLENLKRLQEEQEAEKERLEKIRIEEEKKRQLSEKTERGLSALNDKNLNDDYIVKDFKTLKRKTSDWLTLVKFPTIPENQREFLLTALLRLRKKPDNKERKEWGNRSSKLWLYIESITDKDFTDKAFNLSNQK